MSIRARKRSPYCVSAVIVGVIIFMRFSLLTNKESHKGQVSFPVLCRNSLTEEVQAVQDETQKGICMVVAMVVWWVSNWT